MKFIFNIIIASTLLCPSFIFNKKLPIKNIIFDINNVLLSNDQIAYVWHIGPTYFLKYMTSLIYNKKKPTPETIKKRMYKILRAVEPRTKNSPLATSPDGKLIPEIMYQWQINKISSEEAKEKIHSFIKKNPKFFISKAEQQFMLQLTETIFSPTIHSKMKYIVPNAINFIKKLKNQDYNIYILSNYDKNNFKVAYKTHKSLFKYIEPKNIVISGTSGKIKPNKDIYTYFLQKYNLAPESCVFFDDKKENIIAAQKLGIYGIQVPKQKKLFQSTPNINYIEKKLKQLILNNKID